MAARGGESRRDVVLLGRLLTALKRLNPDLPPQAIWQAIDALVRDRSAMLPVRANREVYDLLKDGVKAQYRDDRDEEVTQTVRVIDWETPEANDFFLASQFWISRRSLHAARDLVGFVNGIPLLLHRTERRSRSRPGTPTTDNLRDYTTPFRSLFRLQRLHHPLQRHRHA